MPRACHESPTDQGAGLPCLARGYGLYYTGTQVASALFPILYGMLADGVGLTIAFATLAVVTAAIAPLSLTMRTRPAA